VFYVILAIIAVILVVALFFVRSRRTSA